MKVGDIVVSTDFIGGNIAKEDHRYVVTDNTYLKNLVLSKTSLQAQKETTGHRHPGQEEVYTFINGEGRMEVDYLEFPVKAGNVVLIPDGAFHKVKNTGDYVLEFICVFDGKRHTEDSDIEFMTNLAKDSDVQIISSIDGKKEIL